MKKVVTRGNQPEVKGSILPEKSKERHKFCVFIEKGTKVTIPDGSSATISKTISERKGRVK